MSENKMSDNSDSFQLDDVQPVNDNSVDTSATPPVSDEALINSLTDEQKKLFDEVKQSVTDYKIPENFIFSLPNLLRNMSVDLETLSDAQKTEMLKDEKNIPLLQAQEEAEMYMLRTQSKHALLFSAKLVPLQGNNMKEFVARHNPNMFGRAKIVLIHKDTWELLKNYSFVMQHHRSFDDPDLSDVHAIHAYHRHGAEVNYLESVNCVRCSVSPAPFKCEACSANYCSSVCRALDKEAHDPQCLSKIMQDMTLTVKQGRENFNQNSVQFQQEQAEFEKRNKGKEVTVRQIDNDGKVISETKRIVVPADHDQEINNS